MNYKWIKKTASQQNLSSFLRQQGFSRTQLKKIKFHQGHIYVNHKRRYLGYQVQAGDEVIVVLPNETSSDNIQSLSGKLDVLFEDDNYLLLNKPAGVASLPTPQQKTATMANYVKAYLQETNQDNDVVHLVSRLDRDTSGIITFAKNAYAHHLIDQQFRTDTIKKEYLALVHGNFAHESQKATIDLPIGIDPEHTNLRCIDAAGKPSLTEYSVKSQNDAYSLVKLRLITGRTHQIRVHMAAIGHPLLGDSYYGGASNLISRQALHCFELTFWDYVGNKEIAVRAPLPADLAALVRK